MAAPLVLLAVLALACAQTPVFRIGGTQTSCGNGADQSAAMRSALLFYANYTNNNGGVMINGTRHDLDIIIYNDARDPELVQILYERLIFVDQVHALLSPFANSIPAFALARTYGIPMVNIFDLAYYSTGAPNGTWGGWVFSAVPNPLTFVDACYSLLKGYGLQTVSSAWPDDISLFALDFLNILVTAKASLALKYPQYSVPNNLTGVSDVVRRLKADKGDIFSGGMLLVDSLQGLLNEMRVQRYNPQAILFWAGVLFKSFRDGAGWQAHRIFGASPWDPTLNFTDAQFGSSQNFARIYQSTLGVEPEATTALAIFGAQSLKLAAEKAGSLDRDDLRVALLGLNEETFFGLANYSFPLQQTQGIYYCFQVDDDGNLNPVSANAPSRVRKPVLWPALATEPADFRTKGTSNRNRWIALGVGLGVGMLVLIAVALVLLYLWKVKYRVIFIPKAADAGEW